MLPTADKSGTSRQAIMSSLPLLFLEALVYIGSDDGNIYALGGSLPLTLSISPTSASLDIGQNQLYTASPQGSSGSYSSYQWYVDGSILSESNCRNFQLFSNRLPGSHSITAKSYRQPWHSFTLI